MNLSQTLVSFVAFFVASSTVVDAQCPEIPSNGCSICGDGKIVDPAKANNIFQFPGQPALGCGMLQTFAIGGTIPLDQCAGLPAVIDGTTQFGDCGCMSCNGGGDDTMMDTTPSPVSSAPVAATTPSPTITPVVTTDTADEMSNGDETTTMMMPCPPVTAIGCSVCGSGKMVDPSKAENLFEFPGQPLLSCSLLESVGSAGSIPLDQCASLPAVLVGNTQFGDCGCMDCMSDDNSGTAPTPMMMPTPTCPEIPSNGCSICGEGKMIDPSKSENTFEYPDQPALPCGTLEAVGIAGTIPLEQCALLSTVLSDTQYGDCGCMTCGGGGGGNNNDNVSNPTPAPVRNPTRSPTPRPTAGTNNNKDTLNEPNFPPAMDQSTSGASSSMATATFMMMMCLLSLAVVVIV